MAVEDQCPQGLVDVAARGRDAPDDGLENLFRADAFFGRRPDGFGGIDRQYLFNLFGHAVGVGGGQVDLVDDRHDLQVVVECQIDIGEGLRFDPLSGIHDQHCPFTGGQRAGDLVSEVHMSRRIDQVQFVGHTVMGFIINPNRCHFNCNAALTLDIHRVKELLLHMPPLHGPGKLQQAVGQGRFPMVDVSDNAEVADSFLVIG